MQQGPLLSVSTTPEDLCAVIGCWYPTLGLSLETPCVGLARIGSETQTIAHDKLASVCRWEMGKPLHSLVIIGHLHPLEEKVLLLSKNAHLV